MAVNPKIQGMGYAQVIGAARKLQPVPATPKMVTQGVPGPIPQANLDQAKGYAGAIAAASAYKTPATTPMTGGVPGNVATPPMYGANVIGNVDTDPESKIAALGQDWASAPKEQRAGIHDRAQAIGTAAGGTYNATTGKWAFPTAVATANTEPVAATPAPYFTAPTPTQQIPTATPSIPVMDEAAIRKYATDQIAAKLAKLRQSADQSITAGRLTADRQLQGLQTGFDRQRANITEDRSLANTAFDRTYSPFSGGTEEKRFQRDFGRERTDREMNADNLSRQANVQQDAANLEQTINEKYAMMQQLAPDEAEAMFQSVKQDERNYEAMMRGELRSDLLANSQLNDTSFNQSLAGYNANRAAFEHDQAFDYGKYRDQVEWTGQLGGGQQTLAAQNQQFNQGQQGWENRFNYGQATGTFGNGQQTLEARQANLGNLWKVAEATGTIPDEIGKMYGLPKGTSTMDAQKFGLDKRRIDADIANMNADNSRLSSGGGSSGGGSGGNPKPASMNTIIDNINSRFLRSKTDIGAGASYNPTALENYILSIGGLTEQQITELYNYYQLPLPK